MIIKIIFAPLNRRFPCPTAIGEGQLLTTGTSLGLACGGMFGDPVDCSILTDSTSLDIRKYAWQFR